MVILIGLTTTTNSQVKRKEGFWDAYKADYVSRLNYGVIAVKVGRVCVVDGYVAHTFHLTLPRIVNIERNKIFKARNDTACTDEMCQRMAGVYTAIQDMTIHANCHYEFSNEDT
jgi:hypothetical protein